MDNCFIVKTDHLSFFESLGAAKKLNQSLSLLLIYWKEDYKILCNLNPSIPTDILIHELLACSKRNKLADRLKRKSLSFRQIKSLVVLPTNKRSHLVLFCSNSYIGNEPQGILPQDNFLEISFRLIEKDKTLVGGIIRILNTDRGFLYTRSDSKEDFIRNYIQRHEESVKSISNELYKEIIREIML